MKEKKQENQKTSEQLDIDSEQVDTFDIENDPDYQKWCDNFQNMSSEEKSEYILNQIKEQISDVDKELLDKIVQLVKDNPDKHTDLLWLQETLEKDYPEITPLAITNYFLILKLCGIITLE